MFKLFTDLFKPPLQMNRIKGLQLEVSTICQLSCVYCPRTQAQNWPNQFMSWEMYKERISPHFELFEMIYLQGWGEPLTNPHFWRMVELAKATNREVGFTTNGILFDQEAADRACNLGVDLISFTFTGSTPATHEFYRVGSNFNDLTNKIRMLSQKKRLANTAKPTIGISFTMMRNNLHEFSDVVKLALELGADQITASHMDCISMAEMERHAVFLNPCPDDSEHIRSAAQIAKLSKAPFKAEPPRLTGEILACEPNPLRITLFIRADGTVVPCHQMALPPSTVKSLYYHGTEYEYHPITLGNVLSENLSDILNNSASKDLRNTFGLRQAGLDSIAQKIPDAPAICQKCYKLYGV